MLDPLVFTTSIFIRATREAVWKGLTHPDFTQQYMFGCVPLTDWKIGNEIIWRGVQDGVDYVKGHVTHYDPPNVLGFTVFSPHSDYPDVAKNYLKSQYTLVEEKSGTRVMVTQGDFSTAAGGQKRYEEAEGSWNAALEGLRKVLEESDNQ